MENEENRFLIDKKASRHQLVPFFSSIFEFSHYSLFVSHSWILRVFLEQFSIVPRKRKQEKEGQERNGKQGSSKEKKDLAAPRGILAGNISHV